MNRRANGVSVRHHKIVEDQVNTKPLELHLGGKTLAPVLYVQMPSGFASRMPSGFTVPKGWLTVWDRSLGATVAYPQKHHWDSAD